MNGNRLVASITGLAALLLVSSLAASTQGIPQTAAVRVSAVPDAGGIRREALVWLADLIRINTSNPPGNEQLAAKYVAEVLQKEGIKPEDGYLYGRGAIDDKGMLAANLAVFVGLKRANAHINRDVIFLATADEEGGGDSSIRMLIAKYWDKFAAGFAINEGGNVFMKNGKVQYIGVQASEKVAANISVIARGPSGHASQPTKDNAVVHLASAIAKIGAYSAPVHFTAIVRRYFEGIGPLEDDEIAKWIRSMDTPDRGEHAQRVVSDASPLWNAMMRDTIAPTVLSAGVANNVIPAEARANLNVRLLPGDSIFTVMNDLNKLVNDPAVKLEVQPNAGLAAPPSSLESDLYNVICRVASQEFAGAPALPVQSTPVQSARRRLGLREAGGPPPAMCQAA